jgi:hypothetical protein
MPGPLGGVTMRSCLQATAILAAVFALACWAHSDSEVHLLPAGFAGPVVIIYGDTAAPEAARNDEGATVYQIPDSGVLRVRNAPRPVGFYDLSYFYEAPDGARTQIPSSEDSQGIRIFGAVDGVTGSDPDEVRWQAYVVGDPDASPEWGWQRDAHVSLALGHAPPIRPRAP